jgi:peroxiredoxin
MRRFFTLILLILLAAEAFSSSTVISGTATGKEGKTVRLLSYADQLSYKKVTLASSRVAENGTFTLSLELNSTTYAMLDLDYRQAEIFLLPGESYKIVIIPDGTSDEGAYYDRAMLSISIITEDPGKLNESIGNINSLYNDFLIENGHLLQSPSRTAKVLELEKQMEAQVKPGSDPYLVNYLRYKSASVELFMKVKSRDKLAAGFLTGKTALYDNVEYMDFFHLYFEKYMVTNNAYMPYSKTSLLVNGTASLAEITAELMKDPVLADPRLAEMVLLAGLKEMSVMTGFKQPRVLELLEQVVKESKFQENSMIAANLRDRILWMKQGYMAPDFELPGLSGGKHALSDYSGKYLYLSFIDLHSPASLAEMNLMAGLYEKYQDKVHFVSIVAQGLTIGWNQVVKDYGMDWDLLKVGDDPALLESYGAVALPVFVLIDPRGKIFKYPAPSPSEDLAPLFDAF